MNATKSTIIHHLKVCYLYCLHEIVVQLTLTSWRLCHRFVLNSTESIAKVTSS